MGSAGRPLSPKGSAGRPFSPNGSLEIEGLLGRALAQFDFDVVLIGRAVGRALHDGERDFVVGLEAGDTRAQIVLLVNRLAIHGDDDIALLSGRPCAAGPSAATSRTSAPVVPVMPSCAAMSGVIIWNVTPRYAPPGVRPGNC